MKQLTLFLFRKRNMLLGALLGLMVLGATWWIYLHGINDLRWQYISPCGIRLPLRYAVHGIDVSHHNQQIDWKQVCNPKANGIALQFVFMKATEGATHLDRRFRSNWRESQKFGLRRGAYHFYHPQRDPAKQAAHFIHTVQLEPGDFVPVLDFEKDGNIPAKKLVDDLRIWLDKVEDHYGVKPIIYTNSHFYLLYINRNFEEYPLWIADYSTQHVEKYKNSHLYLWQHSKSGRLNGIRGFVDFNVFLFEPERLKEICLE